MNNNAGEKGVVTQLETGRVASVKDSKKLTLFFKGIAILLVILVHSHQRFLLSDAQRAIQKFGQMGCQIFFVLSSFGLCHSFSKETPENWLSHMKKRISKIAIGYWGAIFLTAVYRVLFAIVLQEDLLPALNIPGIIINALFLNGLVPVEVINNTIVRGGWYIGTTVILYALFPLLYKVFFCSKKSWVRRRVLIFPMTVFFTSAAIVIIAGFIHPAFSCHNNSFVYFSFINQLAPFSLGIVLFDLVNRCAATKYAPHFSAVCFLIAIILFYGDYKYSFVFCPTFVALAFMFLFWHLSKDLKFYNFIHSSNKIVGIINKFGEISFPIYLTHPFVVYEFSLISLKILRHIYHVDLLWYLILLPIEFCLAYFVGYIYNKCIFYIKNSRG